MVLRSSAEPFFGPPAAPSVAEQPPALAGSHLTYGDGLPDFLRPFPPPFKGCPWLRRRGAARGGAHGHCLPRRGAEPAGSRPPSQAVPERGPRYSLGGGRPIRPCGSCPRNIPWWRSLAEVTKPGAAPRPLAARGPPRSGARLPAAAGTCASRFARSRGRGPYPRRLHGPSASLPPTPGRPRVRPVADFDSPGRAARPSILSIEPTAARIPTDTQETSHDGRHPTARAAPRHRAGPPPGSSRGSSARWTACPGPSRRLGPAKIFPAAVF